MNIKKLFLNVIFISFLFLKIDSFILPQIFREWTPIAIENKIDKSKAFNFNIGKLPLILWYDNNDSIISTINICKHLGSKLDKGNINNGCLYCPNHYTSYNNTDKIGNIISSNGILWWSYKSYSRNPPLNFKNDHNMKLYNTFIDVDVNIINVILEFIYSCSNNNQIIKECKKKFLFKETLFNVEHRYLYKYPYYIKGNINRNIDYSINFLPLEEAKTRIFITINNTLDSKIYMNYYLSNKINNLKNYYDESNYLNYLIILKDSPPNNHMKKIYTLFDKYSFPNQFIVNCFYKYRQFY